jgi:hypothetical protein
VKKFFFAIIVVGGWGSWGVSNRIADGLDLPFCCDIANSNFEYFAFFAKFTLKTLSFSHTTARNSKPPFLWSSEIKYSSGPRP